MPDQTSMASR